MKINSINQSNNYSNKAAFKGTVQILVKERQPHAKEIILHFYRMLDSHSPTAIKKDLSSNQSGFYEVMASFPYVKDIRVGEDFAKLICKHNKEGRDISFRYVSEHAMTPQKLKKYKPPVCIFPKSILNAPAKTPPQEDITMVVSKVELI